MKHRVADLDDMTPEELRLYMYAKDGKPVGFGGSHILNTIAMIGQDDPLPGTKKKKVQAEFILGGADYSRTDTADIDPKVKARLVPAIKHPQTGKIYLGRRGEDHGDVLDRHNLRTGRKLNLPGFDSTIHSGYYDHVTKKFYSHKEAGFHASDLMTGLQRFKKYGSEQMIGVRANAT